MSVEDDLLGLLVEEVDLGAVDRDLDAVAVLGAAAGRDLGDQLGFAAGEIEEDLRAHQFGQIDVRVDDARRIEPEIGLLVVQVLGADAEGRRPAHIGVEGAGVGLARRDLDLIIAEHRGVAAALFLDRDVEDYELEVGSAGITSPFKVLRQYVKNIGNEVEMLLKNGSKLTGVLKSADENGVVVSVEKKVKPEGAKRKVTVVEDESYTFDEIKYTKYLIRFK